MEKISSKVIILFIIFHLSALGQTTYYVSNSIGNDNSDGSIDSPFETIGKAISEIDAGDSVIIRGGLYHEEILIDNLNSPISSPTLIKSFDGETVVIDGTIEILGQWNDDNSNSSIKVVNGIDDQITQLFVGNEQMVMARWPNAQFNDQSIFDKHNWAEGDESTSQDGQLYIDESKKDPGTINLTNSVGILNVGSFKTFTKRITNHTIQNGNDLIEYDGNFGNSFKTKHHYFFFEGKKELIDVQNEWFLDQENEMLFVFPPNGVDLNNTSVRGKVRDYSVLIDNSSHVKIEGLTFFGTTFKADRSDNITIYNCNFYYPSHSRRMLGYSFLEGALPTVMGTSGYGDNTKNSIDRVNNSTIEKCLFINTEGEGLIIRGNNNKVLNSYFKNIDWSATELDGLMVTINVDGSNNEFSHNEIYNTGASATVWPGEESIFSYNVVSNTGLAQSDGAVFQGTKNTVANSVVHHNFVYDTEKYAFRYDAPGGNAEEAGSYGVMHHNIADNTMGLMIKGNNQIIANNTVINTINNRNDIIILAEDCSNNNTWLYNNLAERIGSHRSSTQFELSCDAPIPIGSVGYISDESVNCQNENKVPWRVCKTDDGNIFSGTGSGVSIDNIDQLTANRTGISTEADVTTLLTYNSSNDKNVTNYVPSSDVLIDKGSAPINQVYTSTTEQKYIYELVPQTSVGDAPDIGAIDQSNIWTPGIDWVPDENFDIVNALTLANPTIVKDEIFVYPNPTEGIIKITPDRNLEFIVFDINGTIIFKGFGNTINLSSFANGVYFLKVKTQNSRMYTILKE